MPIQPDYNFNFSRGLRTDGGPFFAEKGYYRDAKNAIHNVDGSINNRRGIELLNEDKIDTITIQSDATNLFFGSIFFAEIVKENGQRLNTILLRNGRRLRLYCNDGATYTNSLENLDIFAPDFDFTLDDVSDEAMYYKTRFTQEGNTIIMTNPKSPIYKVHWHDSSFSTHKIQLVEINEDLYDITAAKSKIQSLPGWYSVDIPLETGTSSYTVDQFFASAAPSSVATIYKYDANGVSTRVDPADYTFSESYDSDINLVTMSLTYSGGTTGEIARVFIGRTSLPDQISSLSTDQVVISSTSKNYKIDNSFAPSAAMLAFGRAWFAGMFGAIDAAQESAISGYGAKYRKIWVSSLFPRELSEHGDITLKCAQNRSPFDAADNVVTHTDGGIIEPDDASRIKGLSSYQNAALVAAGNGVWAISGPEEVFSFLQIRITRAIDASIGSSEPMASTEAGVFVAGDNDFYNIFPSRVEGSDVSIYLPPVKRLVEDRLTDLYRNIPEAAKKQAFVRYDSYNSRVYYFYPDTTSGNKYDVSGASQKFLIYDLNTRGWTGNGDITAGDWSIQDMVTVPVDSYFTSSDPRFEKKKVNLVLLSKKNGNFTDITFGILEGKNYCADYYGTSFKAAFESYVDTFNSFSTELGILNKKQVYRVYVAMQRTEQDDATSGFYEFPGAVYLSKRVHFADHEYAGPLFGYSYNSATNTWDANPKQIYFPNKIGSTVIGGGKPPHEVILAKLKVAGKGSVLRLKFGNKFGDTSLTGTIQEQEKPWGVFGYQVELKRYQ